MDLIWNVNCTRVDVPGESVETLLLDHAPYFDEAVLAPADHPLAIGTDPHTIYLLVVAFELVDLILAANIP